MNPALLDLSGYIKFFVGLFALVNPVGIIPVFISLTADQVPAARNKTNLTANLSVTIILWISLFLGDGILHLFGISIDSFRIAGGILVVTIAMSMISGKLGEDKQNKQEKSETASRENMGVVPLALPLMAWPGAISSTIVWSSRYNSWQNLLGFRWQWRCSPYAAGCCFARHIYWSGHRGRPGLTWLPVLWGYC